jgi:hypothetical protein
LGSKPRRRGSHEDAGAKKKANVSMMALLNGIPADKMPAFWRCDEIGQQAKNRY